MEEKTIMNNLIEARNIVSEGRLKAQEIINLLPVEADADDLIDSIYGYVEHGIGDIKVISQDINEVANESDN